MVRRGLRADARWAGVGLAMCRNDRARAATAALSDQSGLAGGGQCLRAVTVLRTASRSLRSRRWTKGGSPVSARRQSALPPRQL